MRRFCRPVRKLNVVVYSCYVITSETFSVAIVVTMIFCRAINRAGSPSFVGRWSGVGELHWISEETEIWGATICSLGPAPVRFALTVQYVIISRRPLTVLDPMTGGPTQRCPLQIMHCSFVHKTAGYAPLFKQGLGKTPREGGRGQLTP